MMKIEFVTIVWPPGSVIVTFGPGLNNARITEATSIVGTISDANLDSWVLERALVVSADGAGWHTPAELGLSYRRSGLRQGQVVAEAEFRLTPRPSAEIKSIVAGLQAQRKAAQPTNKRTYGSVFKNPEHELTAGRLLEACGLKGHRLGGAQISPRHANFIENADGARSEDAIALMTEARRRAWEQYGVELEHEVVFLGELELPPLAK